MRYKDRVDITLSAEDLTLVVGALTVLEEKLPLIGLTKSEIRGMANFGIRNETFAMETIAAAKNNPLLIPPGLNMAMIERDRVAREQLADIAQRVQKLNEKLTHTRKALGADLYGAARAIYKALQEFGRDAGLGDLLDDLARRFKGQGKKKDSSTSNGTTGGTNA